LGKKIKTSAGGLKAAGLTLTCSSKTSESDGREVADAAKIIALTASVTQESSRQEKNSAPRVTRETSK